MTYETLLKKLAFRNALHKTLLTKHRTSSKKGPLLPHLPLLSSKREQYLEWSHGRLKIVNNCFDPTYNIRSSFSLIKIYMQNMHLLLASAKSLYNCHIYYMVTKPHNQLQANYMRLIIRK